MVALLTTVRTAAIYAIPSAGRWLHGSYREGWRQELDSISGRSWATAGSETVRGQGDLAGHGFTAPKGDFRPSRSEGQNGSDREWCTPPVPGP